jgi:hypothetical protein
MDLRVIDLDDKDWIDLFPNGDRRRALVNVVMYVQVP